MDVTKNIEISWAKENMYLKYKGELFAILSALTKDEPKSILRSITNIGGIQDGFRALCIFNRRFDTVTAASLLHMLNRIHHPKPVKGFAEVASSIQNWEADIVEMFRRFDEK